MDDQADTDPEAVAKTVLGWASISYALGFVIVTLHTARLGLPVLELLRPIYVWIGVPLAGAVFFSRRLVGHFRTRSAQLAAEFRASLGAVTGRLKPDEITLLVDGLGLLAAFLPTGQHAFVRWMRDRLALGVSRLAEQERQKDPEAWHRQMRRLQKWIGSFRLLFSLGHALQLAGLIALAGVAIYLYVWVAYPLVPQSLGGGRPTAVELVVEKSALPLSFCRTAPPPCPLLVDRPSTVSVDAELLYMTQEHLFVEYGAGVRIAVASGAVKSIVWRSSAP